MTDESSAEKSSSVKKFIAGGPDDPRHGYGLCLNCPIVHRGYHQ
jgi:hypothetical protein